MMPDSSHASGESVFVRLRNAAFAPVDIASLVFFRIAFGLLMAWDVCVYLWIGRVHTQWIQPRFLFTYYGFSWVEPLPAPFLYFAWGVLGLLACFLAAGFFYRVSALLFFVGITYFFLLDQYAYQNHVYLICLLSLFWIFVPAHRAGSIDVLRGRTPRSHTIPAWTLWIFRFQIAVVYIFGGVAKLSHDWLRGEPMRLWTAGRTDLPIIGRWVNESWAPYALSYGGLLLDLCIVPLLLWRRTRIFAAAVAILFHFLNANMFNIGVFPFLAAAATTLFFSPEWPRRLVARWRGPVRSAANDTSPGVRNQNLILAVLGVYVLIQLLVPFRHLLYPGSVDWTYEGHRFSWRMKLHEKNARARFYVMDPNSGTEIAVNPMKYLRPEQALKMATRPDMIQQFAQYLARVSPRRGPQPLRVEARVLVSLNGRKPAPLVNPTTDLAAKPRTLRPAQWLMPLTEPLPNESKIPRQDSANSTAE